MADPAAKTNRKFEMRFTQREKTPISIGLA
jgi:hypothetical protein